MSSPRKRTPEGTAGAGPTSLTALNRQMAAADPMVEGSDKAVLGEGPLNPDLALVGEQPGDQEDLQGRPFVGPAGKLLDTALADAGIARARIYLTNAVKHFKFVQRGKRRIHQTPTAGEIRHYRWWLGQELSLVGPRVVVALGASAVHALEGRAMPLLRNRGPHMFGDQQGYITLHPSWLLRMPRGADRIREYRRFVSDLERADDLAR